ncbi:ribbon-helix-helix domain-containing protein [Sphingomonas trueperi]|jgi:antitoxin ParD1/3/4|uniref:ribbon-helix-helix domain-containing protein n=1 Tax=Sphingomonas trueperi TaxID=53317 RepID=UPI000EB3AA75
MDDHSDYGAPLEQAISDVLATGRFASRDDLLREGARIVTEREMLRAALHAKIEQGLADADAGRMVPIEQVMEEMRTRWSPQ